MKDNLALEVLMHLKQVTKSNNFPCCIWLKLSLSGVLITNSECVTSIQTRKVDDIILISRPCISTSYATNTQSRVENAVGRVKDMLYFHFIISRFSQ